MRRMVVVLSLSLLAPAWPAAGTTQGGPMEDTHLIPETTAAPVLDGRIASGEWDSALLVADFLQRSPVEGAPSGRRTEVRLMHTREVLYVAQRAYQPAATVVATASRTDDFEQLVKNDQFAVAIDSYNDGRNGFWFSTNPLGTRVDARFQEEGNIWEADWDGAWRCAASVDAEGWTVEIAIPFSTLRFEQRDRVVMGINLYRRIISGSEQVFAPLIPLSYPFGTPNVSAARKYVLEGIGAGNVVAMSPYLLAGLDRTNAMLAENTDLSVGGEVGYRPAPNVAVNGTWNTDFAETEADERQLNLTRFGLFFPEKRDFFLENSGSFQFGQPDDFLLFHSRRIGLAPSAGGGYVPVPIRLGGTASARVGVAEAGMLAVETSPAAGLPAERFLVGRVKVGIARRSYMGVLYTSRDPANAPPRTAAGADLSLYLWGNSRVFVYAATSRDETMPDEGRDHTAWTAGLDRRSEEVNYLLQGGWIGRLFDPAVGFAPYLGIGHTRASVGLPWYVQTRYVRRLVFAVEHLHLANAGGGLLSSALDVRLTAEAPSEDAAGFVSHEGREVLTTAFQIYRDTIIPPGDYTNRQTEVTFYTKPGRPLSASATLGAGTFYLGHRRRGELGVEWKAGGTLVIAAYLLREDVTTPFGSFDARLIRMRLGLGLGPGLHAAMLVQYDGQFRTLDGNTRLTYTSQDGTEVHLVWTHAGPFLPGEAIPGSTPPGSDLLRLKIRFDLRRTAG